MFRAVVVIIGLLWASLLLLSWSSPPQSAALASGVEVGPATARR